MTDRTGFKDLRAVQDGRMHSIYHQCDNAPYHIIAIQQIAKWSRPEEFEDLTPQATFDELHAKFMPYENSGQFWVSMNAPASN